MSEEKTVPTRKPFVLEYFSEAWGGWREMPYDTMVSDDAAEFDSVEAGRKLAQQVATNQPYKTRVVRRSDRQVVAEYAKGGRKIR